VIVVGETLDATVVNNQVEERTGAGTGGHPSIVAYVGVIFSTLHLSDPRRLVLGRGVGGVGPAPIPLVENESHYQQPGGGSPMKRAVHI
jgi:hypothetical protein